MTDSEPILISETNLSHAWGKAFLHTLNYGEISPLIISVSGFRNGEPEEDLDIRHILDNTLKAHKEQVVHTVANTICPANYRRKLNREEFFNTYLKILDKVKTLAKSKNRRGIYFERLIAFGSDTNSGNQLEFIISQYKSRKEVRRSMLQASIFDPKRDHITSAQLGFPCLQHLSFVPNNKKETLSLNAFYATQQIFQKAYGNYLGLCRLGDFMAREMGLKFNKMNCFIGVEKLEGKNVSKKSLAPLIKVVRDIIEPIKEE
ncbi:MAG TPA: hypothetical protein VK184_17800 [Nostocaceae cyanobacterium]|nr:hypothetical protein [Nostocaceae cyanobacterium]